MNRLFIAIPVPSHIQKQFAFYQGGLHGVNWVEPEDFHITLCFLGDTSRHQFQSLIEQLSAIEIEAFEVCAREISIFGKKKLRLIYYGIEATEPILKLHRQCVKVAKNCEFQIEHRSFVPHVTLARLKGTSVDEFINYRQKQNLVPMLYWKADKLAVYSSKPGGGGPYHQEILFSLR